MSAWARAGTYKWCGYYLTSPCHSDGTFAPFTGKAAFLHGLGFGLAIVYVGYQQEGCGSASLSRAEGILHGRDAVARCRLEGFPANAIIFLDIEHFDGDISPAFTAYYQGWLGAILASGRFQPGTYCAKANYSDIAAAARAEFAALGLSAELPAFWIALEIASFNPTTSAPCDCGVPSATLWQGLLDTSQTQCGVTLAVDLNTADSRDPSRSAPCTPPVDVIFLEEDVIEYEED